MAVATQAPRWSRGRRFAVEPLEDRSLLSGFAILSQPDAESAAPSADQSSESVQVLEIAPADEDDGDGDTAREIAIEELPRQVVAAVAARFPGARLAAAEMNSDDGSLVFDVSAEWRGVELEVELSPDGELLQFGQPLESAELPQSVRDWIASNFPGASIREVERVTADDVVSYELLIATSADQAFEAVLRVPGGTPGVQLLPGAFGEPAFFGSGLLDVSDASRFVQAAPNGDPLRATENHSAAAETETLGQAVSVPGLAATESGPQATQRGAPEARSESGQESPDGSVTDSDQVTSHGDSVGANGARGANIQPFVQSEPLHPIISTIASAVPAMWLPQIAQVLVDVFPLDTTALERSLRQFLDEVDSLTDEVTSGSVANQLTPRLLIAVATLAGAERLITQMNRTRRDPVLTSAGGKSTWTWVLNLSDAE